LNPNSPREYGFETFADFLVNLQGNPLPRISNIFKQDSIPDTVLTVYMRKGVKRWRLVSIFPKGRAAAAADLALSSDQYRYLMDYIKTVRTEGSIGASFGCEGFLGGYEFESRDRPFFCTAGVRIGSVLVDGSISACPSLRDDYVQGNIYKDDFLDVWENRFYVMRNRQWAHTGECAKCKVWCYCRGNGLHLRDQKSGKLLFCNWKALQSPPTSV
jgi:radical SAM protein with 4Fe4S-binding SPASM domain